MMSKAMLESRFPREARLHGQADFQRVHQSDVFAADETLVIRAAVNALPQTRIGISISRQVGNAVLRNRWKRLIRESFRLHRAELPAGLDLVVRPRRGATPSFVAIQDSLRQLVTRLGRRLLEKRR